MTEDSETSVLTAKRAPQHIRLSRANDAYEHLCILTLLPSLAPLHLMLADTPWPHGFGATLANVGPLSEGFERSVASPLYLPSGQAPLLGPSPLRTVLKTFAIYGSSPSNALLRKTRLKDGKM